MKFGKYLSDKVRLLSALVQPIVSWFLLLHPLVCDGVTARQDRSCPGCRPGQNGQRSTWTTSR